MNGENFDPEPFKDSGSDWEEDNLEVNSVGFDINFEDDNTVIYPIQ